MTEKEKVSLDLLWKDFATQMHTHLLFLQGQSLISDVFFDEPLRHELTATTLGGYISIWLNEETGRASWNQLTPVDGAEPWALSPDGVVEISGKRMTVSDAARLFAEKLVTR